MSERQSEALISVILSAHNLEQFLPETLASLRAQTIGMNKLQFILIDDASTDATGDILEAFGRDVPHAHIKHADFHGIALSRNYAIEQIAAPYLIFVDGDDLLVPDACEQLIKTATESRSDLVLAPLYRFEGAITPAPAGNVAFREQSVKETWCSLLEHRLYMGHLIGSLFSQRLFATLRFPLLTCYSDIYVAPDLLKQNPRIAWLDRPLYNYRQHGLNISGNLTDEKARGMLKVFDKLYAHITDKTELRLFESFCVRQCRIMLDNTQDLSAETRSGIKKWVDAIPLWPFLFSSQTRLRRKRLLLQTRNEINHWN